MDMGTSTMDHAMATGTAAVASATTSAAAMSMGMGGPGECKISMLWNWNTIDTCFIAKSWHIRSTGMFAGSCIGVILLVMSLEFLRRLSKEYDRYILRQHQRSAGAVVLTHEASSKSSDLPSNSDREGRLCDPGVNTVGPFRPNLLQQATRATLHMVQFAIAYFVMLLAMYYNGYFIICIVIGAWLGAFVFSWETVNMGDSKEEVTVCCG